MTKRTGMTLALALGAVTAISVAWAADTVLTGANAYGDYAKDAPGTWRKFAVADLPAPFATEGVRNASKIVPRPEGAMPTVPSGFSVSAFAAGLKEPRQMKLAPNGDIFLAESGANLIRVIRAASGATKAASDDIFAEVAARPYGIAFFPPGPNPEWVYVASTTEVVRFPYRVGDTKARGAKETIIPNLPSGGHWTRDVIVSPDGKHILLAIGSSSNIQDNGPAAEQFRANILEFNPDGSGRRIYASGIRNPVTIAFNPVDHALWAAVNERDMIGDNLPPDYVTHVQQGKNYGWPYFYIGNHPDPRVKGEPSVPGNQVVVPDVLLQPHSAPLGMAFYTGQQFPAEYRNDLFVAMHGSWNRALRTGYKLVRLKLKDGHATGAYEDFMTGFVTSDGQVWGRPVGVVMASDGSLLMSDDASGTVWRIAHSGQSAAN